IEGTRVEPAPALAAALLARDEAGVLEQGEMLMHRRKRHVERCREVAHFRLAHRQAFYDGATRRIAERGKDVFDGSLRVQHRLSLYLTICSCQDPSFLRRG